MPVNRLMLRRLMIPALAVAMMVGALAQQTASAQSRYGGGGGGGYRHGGGGWGHGGMYGVLPALATVLTIGAVTYWVAEGQYYRALPAGGYTAVPPPPEVIESAKPPSAERMFVYPRIGQTAEDLADDEYDCHRWAVGQTGFDPVSSATGSGQAGSQRRDYRRAQSACLEGRGYTVR